MSRTNRDTLQGLLFLVGIYEGALPFLAKPLGWHPLLAFPVRLDAPAWWLVAAGVLVVAVVAVLLLDRVHVGDDSDPGPHRDVSPDDR